jgi:RimJ/RimL family protein N-acetyltransferase
MSYPSEVVTERLLLRQWRDTDADPLHEIYADPEVERQLVPMTRAATVEQIARFDERWTTHGVSLWAAELLSTGRFIGRIGCMRAMEWPLQPGALEVGWTLARDTWGQGLATEGAQVALDAAFTHLDVDEVISFTRHTNVASRRVMEKLGLQLRGETDYKGIPHVWYATSREHWSAGPLTGRL